MAVSRIVRPLAFGVMAILACSAPTEVCGCSPARSVVLVRGTLLDTSGQPVAGARLHFDAVRRPTTRPDPEQFIGPRADATTDSVGAFRATVYSYFMPTGLELRAAVVRPGVLETVRLHVGPVPFRNDRVRPDSIRITLRLP